MNNQIITLSAGQLAQWTVADLVAAGRAVPAEVLSAIEASPFVPGSAVDDLRAAWARASAVDRAIFFAEAAAEQANVRPAFKAQQFLAYFQRKKTRQP